MRSILGQLYCRRELFRYRCVLVPRRYEAISLVVLKVLFGKAFFFLKVPKIGPTHWSKFHCYKLSLNRVSTCRLFLHRPTWSIVLYHFIVQILIMIDREGFIFLYQIGPIPCQSSIILISSNTSPLFYVIVHWG